MFHVSNDSLIGTLLIRGDDDDDDDGDGARLTPPSGVIQSRATVRRTATANERVTKAAAAFDVCGPPLVNGRV